MDPSTPNAAKRAGFLREGFREIGRRLDRRKLRKQSRTLGTERSEAATRLGEEAWRQKAGLDDSAELRTQLEGLEARAGALSATQTKLQQEKTSLDARQRDETSKYDALRKGVEAKKQPVDAAIETARRRLNEQTRSVANLQARLSSLASQLSALEKPPAQGATQDASKLAQQESRKQQLTAEQKSAAEELAKADASVPALSAEVTRLEGESKQLAAEIQKVEADRKAALAPILAELQRVGGETNAAQKEAGSVADAQRVAWTQLGVALYERKSPEPALAAGIAAMAALDGRRSSTQSALDASLLLTHSMPPGTMLKFFITLVLVPLLLVVLAVGSFLAWTWWQYRPPGDNQTEQTQGETNPLLSQPLANLPPYILADKLANAKSEEEVADLMLQAFKTIHLGVYTADGKQILAGSERNDKDFYLYDFEVRILAHAFFVHNVTNFDDESAGLGASILKLDHPQDFSTLFKQSIVMAYGQARAQPDNPSSFLLLLVDGLARHQVRPYSLDQVVGMPSKDLYLDPLQSFLLELDTFVPPPGNTDDSWRGFLRTPWDEFGVVHAAGPCSEIKGDGKGGDWGATAKSMGMLAGAVKAGGGMAAKVLGSGSAEVAEKVSSFAAGAKLLAGAVGAIHDLLWLYAVTIHIEAIPNLVHWHHDNETNYPQLHFLATVTYQLKDPPQGKIPCGAAAGQSLPPSPQRLKGVQLTWNVVPWDCLALKSQTAEQAKNMTGESHSNVAGSLSGSLGLQTTTEPDGTSQLFVDVTCHCPQPPWSGTRSREYMVIANERYVSSKLPTSIPGGLGPLAVAGMILNRLPGGVEYVMGGRAGYARFTVVHHVHGPYGE